MMQNTVFFIQSQANDYYTDRCQVTRNIRTRAPQLHQRMDSKIQDNLPGHGDVEMAVGCHAQVTISLRNRA